MKKVFAIIAMMGVFTFGMTQSVSAQEEAVEDAFDMDAFFNEMNPTINDAGFGHGFVPDEDNM